MKQIRKRLTYANVMSSIAVFLVLGGAAVAATQLPKNSVGTKQLKKNAVTTAKLKANAVATGKIKKEAVAAGKIKNAAVNGGKLANAAVSTDKLADAAVTGGKLANNAVTTGKIANDAVTGEKLGNEAVSTGKLANGAVSAAKLTESERSEAQVGETAGISATEVPTGLLGNYATATAVVTKALPAGGWVVFSRSEFFNSSIEPRSVICSLFDDGTEIGRGSTPLGEGILTPQGTVSTTSISDGGVLNLRCRAAGDAVFAARRSIVAVRVGTVTG